MSFRLVMIITFIAIAAAGIIPSLFTVDSNWQTSRPLGSFKAGELAKENATTLYSALGKRDFQTFEALLAEGADLNKMQSKEFSLMHQIVALQDLSYLKEAFKHGGNPNQKDTNGLPLLFLALEGNWNIFLALIEKGADVNTWYVDQPIVYAAIKTGHFKKAWLLLENGADSQFTGRPDLSLAKAIERQLEKRDNFSEWQRDYMTNLLSWFETHNIPVKDPS